MKNILLIALFTPPANTIGTHRITGFTRYLSEFGWKPTLLTVKPEYYQSIDNNLTALIPHDVQVYRTSMLARKYNHSSKIHTDDDALHPKSPFFLRTALLPFIKKMYQYVSYPDEYVGWVPFAYKKAIKILSQGQWDAVFTTGGPFSSLEIGYKIKKHTGLPWIVDFRDPWVANPYWNGPDFHRRMIKKTEYKIIQTCDKVTVTTHGMRKMFINRYPEFSEEKFVTITNGYDPDLFENITSMPESHFTLTHAGWFYGSRKPDYLLKALRLMLDTHPEIPSTDIKVRFIGNIPEELPQIVNQLELQNNIELLGILNHQETLNYLKKSNVLLIIGSSDNKNDVLLIPAKLFEYMIAQRPILSLINKGEATDIIKTGQIGESVLPTDIPGISEKIYKMYLNHKNNQDYYHPDEGFISQFNRRELTRQLAAEFDKLCL
jgi:glycosyltransferase involved in cell wall biosynthesis